VEDLLKLRNSFKDSRISFNCQEIGRYQSNKSYTCSYPMYFNERRQRS